MISLEFLLYHGRQRDAPFTHLLRRPQDSKGSGPFSKATLSRYCCSAGSGMPAHTTLSVPGAKHESALGATCTGAP